MNASLVIGPRRAGASAPLAGRSLAGALALLAVLAGPAGADQPAPPAAGTVFRDCPTCPEMVVIPAPDARSTPFAMGRTEVTFDQYRACVEDAACPGGQDDHGWGRGNRPVINVTWSDAVLYAAWLARRTGAPYGLPTEAEWEHAARGTTTTRYWWGDEVGTGHANCRDCATRWSGKSTAPVASLPANPFGLFDTAGNVWEWTADCWTPPEPGRSCIDRAARGGAWYYFPPLAASASRVRFPASDRSYTLGLRVIRRYSPSGP